jgi:hypothetical protein
MQASKLSTNRQVASLVELLIPLRLLGQVAKIYECNLRLVADTTPFTNDFLQCSYFKAWWAHAARSYLPTRHMHVHMQKQVHFFRILPHPSQGAVTQVPSAPAAPLIPAFVLQSWTSQLHGECLHYRCNGIFLPAELSRSCCNRGSACCPPSCCTAVVAVVMAARGPPVGTG